MPELEKKKTATNFTCRLIAGKCIRQMSTTGLNGSVFCYEWNCLLFHTRCVYSSISAFTVHIMANNPIFNESTASLRQMSHKL